jgi:hypothetical protein
MGVLRLAALAAALAAVAAVDRSKFRTCDQAGFCRRHRSKAAEPAVSGRSTFEVAAPRRHARCI